MGGFLILYFKQFSGYFGPTQAEVEQAAVFVPAAVEVTVYLP